MPSRLIHIADDSTKPQISIRQVAEGSQPEYAALSYSWGGDQNFKTTRDRLPGYQANISWETLKPYSTITDVIRVTQALGLEYLWIDALCIVQDDDDDKACELGKMGGIYAGASITTRASMCTTSRDAFMNTEFPQDERPICEVMLPVEGGEAVPVLLSKPPDSFREPIDSRAWCFQERLLSRRILSFDSRFTWWNCQGCVKMDGGPDSFALGITTGAELVGMDDKCLTDPKESLKRWIAYVKDYQARQLTVGADKLQAIAAVAEYLQQAIPGQYLAGLWSYELNSQLLWHTIPPWPDKIRPRPPFRAPSWSWASVDDSRVEFETDQWGWQIEDRLQIDGYSTEPIYPQVPFGAVNAASLTVTGRLKYVMLEEGRVVDAQEVLPGGSKFTDSTFSVDFSADAAEDRTYLTGTKAIYMLEVAINSEDHVLGLILKLKAPNMYERIGMFRVLGGILPKPDMDSNDASDSDLASDAELVLIGNGSHDELALDSDQLQAGSDGSQDSQHVEWDDADDDYSIFENAPAEDFFSGLERVKLILL